MASYRSSDYNTANSTSVVVTKPTGLTAGDLLVAICSEGNSGGEFNTPSGWTRFKDFTTASLNQTVVVFVKVASAGDAAATDFEFTFSGSSIPLEAVVLAISGTFASATNIYASVAEGGTEAVSDVFRCTTGITPYVTNSLLIMYFRILCSDSDNNAMSAYAIQTDNISPWTEHHDVQDNGGSNTIRIGVASGTREVTTATGYFQAGISTGTITDSGSIGLLLAISDTANGNTAPATIGINLAVQVPTVTASGQTAIAAPLLITSSINDATANVTEPTWKNRDKSPTSTVTNRDKSEI